MDFLFQIAILHTLFYFIWTYLFNFPIALIFEGLLKIKSMWIGRITKAFGTILISLLSVNVVLEFQSNTFSFITYSIIAGLFLIFNLIMGSAEARKNANDIHDMFERHIIKRELDYEYIYWAIAIIFYVITFFVPVLYDNPINIVFFDFIDLIMNIETLSWIIYGLSVLFLLNMIFKGLMGVFLFISIMRNND